VYQEGKTVLYRRTAAVTTALAITLTLTATTASARDINVPPWSEQTVYELGPTDNYVAEWMGLNQGWTTIGGPAASILNGSAGLFETDQTTGAIYEYNGTPNSWTRIGGPGTEFVEGGGHLYGLAPDKNYVAEWNGTPGSWTIIGGPASKIWAGTDGLIAQAPAGDTQDVWYYNGTPGSWTKISGPAFEFAVGLNAIYRISTDSSTISQWTGGTTWTTIQTTGQGDAEQLIAGATYVTYFDFSQWKPLEYEGTPGKWKTFGTVYSPGLETTSSTMLFGYQPDDEIMNIGVYMYTDATGWVQIGGPADPALAAGD
jgi:hypothetical protein